MREYDREEYEDLDEYEEETEEQEEEEAGKEEEPPQPTREELEYLELRQRLKESIRKQLKKESGSALANSQNNKNKLPYNNFGSFFGPSQAVIAQRVIQESKSLLENPHLVSKISKSSNGNNKSSASPPVRSKPQTNGYPPKIRNGLKTKVQMLKNTRDYSFLLSDDAELPAPAKDPPPRNVCFSNAVARSIQEPPKSKHSLANTGRKVLNGPEGRKPVLTGSQMQSKMGTAKLTYGCKVNVISVDSRKQLGSNNGSGPGRPLGLKELPFPRVSSNGSGAGRPLGPKVLPSKIPAATTEKKGSAPNAKCSAPSAKSSMPSMYKPSLLKLQSSKQPVVQKKKFQEPSKGKIMPKPPVSASKPQVKQPPPKISARASLHKERPKKKTRRRDPNEDDDEDGAEAISMIRKMFGYNPYKYRDDDDDSDMEAGFDDILREEKRSAMIAKREDEEELLKIEEEERRERLRKESKRRKLSQR